MNTRFPVTSISFSPILFVFVQYYVFFSFIGPVAGALTNKFGFRFVAILGAFLEALGVFLSAFTPNLEFLYFSVGILIGELYSTYYTRYGDFNKLC